MIRYRKMLWALALGVFIPSFGFAQGLNITSGGDSGPVEILADDGIEWQQNENVFIARGNAEAIRGAVHVNSDLLRAHYHDNAGKTEIWRLDAEGNVVITSPTEKVYGDNAVYDVLKGVLVVTGDDVLFEAGKDTIRAKKQLEYWETKLMAVARGDAVAVREDKTLYADVLVGHFRRNAGGSTEVYKIDAYDNVRIVTTLDTVTADRGVYDVPTGIATLTGNVFIKRGANELKGCSAKVNLNSGVSKIFACENGSGTRVQGTFQPAQQSTQ